MIQQAVYDYFRQYNKEHLQVVACGENAPEEADIAAFESRLGFRLPEEFRMFTMSPLGGMFVQAQEKIWPHAKAYDVGPFWSFLRGIKVFGIAEEIPDWLDIRVQYEEMKEETTSHLVPFLQREGDGDEKYCFNENGQIILWSASDPEEETLIEQTFSELFMQEIAELEERIEKKIKRKDRV